MTLEEAIDRNKELRGELISEGRLEKADAVQLGIEALEFVKKIVGTLPEWKGFLLPGETRD
jgi:hypothetical protein